MKVASVFLPAWFIIGLSVVEVLHLREFFAVLAWLHDRVVGGLVRVLALLWEEGSR